jgi:hypothetical protein
VAKERQVALPGACRAAGALDRKEEGVDLATPSSGEMHMLKGRAVERSEAVPRNAYKL